MSSLNFKVKWGKEVLNLTLPSDATVKQLREELQNRTNVPTDMQKLMVKGILKDDSQTITQVGIKEGTKMMMMGSTVQQVIDANTAPGQSSTPAANKKRKATWEEPVWTSPPFASILADPFVEGTGLTNGHIVHGLMAMDMVLGRINKVGLSPAMLGLGHVSQGDEHGMLSLFDGNSYQKLAEGQALIKACLEIGMGAAKAEKPEEIKEVLEELMNRINALAEGKMMLVPGGWWGMAQRGWVLHIIERTGDDTYSFVTCNSGAGLEYHPSTACDTPSTPPKMKYKTCLRINDIPGTRMKDVAFWTMMFSLWMKPNNPKLLSEYNRVEVLYDVLLPWLAEIPTGQDQGVRLLNSALLDTATDPCASWRTPDRAASSSTTSVMEGLIYLYRKLGLTQAHMKQLFFVIRWEFMMKASEDLLMRAKRHEKSNPDVTTAISEVVKAGVTDFEPITLEPFKTIVKKSGDEFLRNASGKRISVDSRVIVGLYFGAESCEACQAFTPILKEAYSKIKARGMEFEIVSVGLDSNAAGWRKQSEDLPWLLAPYPGNEVAQEYGVQKIPTLLLFDTNGTLMTGDGREAVVVDIDGKLFPGSPWNGASPLKAVGAQLLELGCRQVAYAAAKEKKAGRLANLQEVKKFVDAILNLVKVLPREDGAVTLPPPLAMESAAKETPFPHFGLMKNTNVEKYAGAGYDASMPALPNLDSIPSKLETADQAMAAIITAHSLCMELLNRAKKAGTSSRLALQLEVISLIGHVFTNIIPMPSPNNDSLSSLECIWLKGFVNEPKKSQDVTMDHLYKLTLIYTTAWQNVEEPSRGFDSERGLVAISILTVFDVVARMNPAESILASLLAEDGGYIVSTGMCQNSRPFQEISERMELVNPHTLHVRSKLLAYWNHLQKTCSQPLFEFRMPDKIELRKYSSTVTFLRKFMERCGYELISRNAMSPSSEMEALMDWMTNPHSKLAMEHPEFAMIRDMALLVKFLTTMESREAELLRRRKDIGEFYTWRLSFEEDAGGRRLTAGWRTSPRPPTWECMGIRGRDLDIADLQVVGFGDRELRFGEGKVVQSPSDLSRIMGIQHASEDDILHADHIPTFGGVLSHEEAEELLCYLTVDYIRIPLVLNFFASQDRSIYLFNGQLQDLLRAVIFEPGPWVPPNEVRDVESVPMRMNALQKREKVIERLMKANVKEDDSLLLGTPMGLLLNELCCCPDASLIPFFTIISSIKDLTNSSVYSSNASYILYIVSLAVDVETFVVHALQMQELGQWDTQRGSLSNVEPLKAHREKLREFLHGIIASTLQQWQIEAEAANDMPTASVIHAYQALIWSNLCAHEVTPEAVVAMVGNLAFVRARHGFGLGMLRSQLLEAEGEDALSPEARLVRFLQAQGINTGKVDREQLDRGRRLMTAGGRRRALFLHISSRTTHDTIRVPTLMRQKANADGGTSGGEGDKDTLLVPPANVPEGSLFALLQRHRKVLVKWFDSAAPDTVNHVLHSIVRVVLQGQYEAKEEWMSQNAGRFLARQAELKFDVQGAELFWRNDELKPVPDSMTHFADFETILGREALQCGLVKRSQHRNWVHIIGTDLDLVEWDEPDVVDQGLGVPIAPPMTSFGGDMCGICGRSGECWVCGVCTASNCGMANAPNGTPCPVCGTPKGGGPGASAAACPDEDCMFEGVRYNRKVEVYGEFHPQETERWAINIVKGVFQTAYPQGEMKWDLLLPDAILPDDAAVARLVGNDAKQYDDSPESATWKEVVVHRQTSTLHVYNLVSHGRKLFRSLVYTSNVRFSMHGMGPILKARPQEFQHDIRYHAGDIKKRRQHDTSLVILRHNKELKGQEMFMPPRLLQGLIPGCLLEAFHFWQGEDGIIRGTPVEDDSQWFGYILEIDPTSTTEVCVYRRAIDQGFTQIKSTGDNLGPLQRHEPTTTASSTSGPPVDIPEDTLLELMNLMGGMVGMKACRKALEHNGANLMLAFEWLNDDANQAAILMAEVEVEPATPDAGPIDPPTTSDSDTTLARLGTLEEEGVAMNIDPEPEAANYASLPHWNLLNLMDAVHREPLIGRLGSVLTRLEDLSHILVWTTSDTKSTDPLTNSVTIIELPRLSARFQPQKGPDDQTHLYLMDHPGWFISDRFAVSDGKVSEKTGPGTKSLQGLTSCIDQCIVLENHAQELLLMVPNHDVYRPEIKGDPFIASLVFDRGSMGWQEVVGTPFYMYPVHPSKTFLLPGSLSATLYLALLRFMKFNHQDAFTLIEACSVDTTFTTEENWIFQQFDRTINGDTPDMHPDAHACRLRLSMAVLYSDNKPTWQIHSELDRYLSKSTHVSTGCRLTSDEELDLLVKCEKGTPTVKNRLEYLKAVNESRTTVVQKGAPIHMCGQPWSKLNTMGQNYLFSRASTIQRVQYKSPGATLDDFGVLQMVWEDSLLMDEESGTTRQLGFMFLYELLTGAVTMNLLGTNCTTTMGHLLLRHFHLKLARWGREAIEDGEADAVVSRQIAALAAITAIPSHSWPHLNVDGFWKHSLARGVNLQSQPQQDIFGGPPRENPVKNFIEALDGQLRVALRGPLQPVQNHLQGAIDALHTANPSVNGNVTIPDTLPFAKGRPVPSDTSCDRVTLKPFKAGAEDGGIPLDMTLEDLKCFASGPLSALPLADFLQWEDLHGMDEKVSENLPFDVSKHPAASTEVAQDMLKRMAGDMTTFANQVNNAKVPVLHHLSKKNILACTEDATIPSIGMAIKSLDGLIAQLDSLQAKDDLIMEAAINAAEVHANAIEMRGLPGVTLPSMESTSASTESTSADEFFLKRISRQYPTLRMDWLTAVLLSSTKTEDLLQANPMMKDPEGLVPKVLMALLHCSRYHHANQAMVQAKTLRGFLQGMVARAVPAGDVSRTPSLTKTSSLNDDTKALAERLHQLASALAEILTAKRHFMKATADGGFSMDPRFMVFEYIFNILLRERQVEMVEWFVRNVKSGSSRVQQMLMGAGKTTVVGPLLALVLADGHTLVTQVMPTALLEQSRNILRRCFSVIIPKQVYTLQFERSMEESSTIVGALFAKLANACRRRAVVCAPPEAIKSLMLKFVEQLHALEKVNSSDLMPGASARLNKEIRYLREKTTAQSDMADALVKILDLWKSGVLIMDEVDVLLHPLRSELNFPIGHKVPIDLGHRRWDYPIHLMDAVFYRQRKAMCEPLDAWIPLESMLGCTAQAVLDGIVHTLDEGLKIHALQREPHLVLLDPAFYHMELKPWMAKWSLLWLYKNFGGATVGCSTEVLLKYLIAEQYQLAEYKDEVEAGLMPEALKYLNLCHDWLRTLLPHVLGKIDRVSFGLLSPADLLLVDPNTPQTRKLMAVPFIGKDVPSRSSEFAHPDVLIGLTVLAYRYEGLRKTDLHGVLVQLKQDYSRQAGPRDQRPAAALFNKWLALASKFRSNDEAEDPGILPLSLFQPNDPKQLSKLFHLVRRLPELVHHLLCQHVFPVTMNFQQLKVSACGHELGSDILFGSRIGFSGTPSNLLPMDLGGFQYDAEGKSLGCEYEPGSDGKILHVLTNPRVTTAQVLSNDWSPHSLLKAIATANPPFHALIDTGAFVTNMDNEEVARFLLQYLPEFMEGVVFLDRNDRQMILLRSSSRVVPLSQCGISPSRRFTFYDQIHTTGMDIKQAPTGCAVVTIGKDMTFRDYAQGSYRMRGIGKGQTIHLYIIPEVQNRIEQQLGKNASGNAISIFSGRMELDVPAWLLLNSMRMEGLQFFKLSSQELFNVWRKQALWALTEEVRSNEKDSTSAQRLRRFEVDGSGALRNCIEKFREPIGYPVPDTVPVPRPYVEKLQDVVQEHIRFVDQSSGKERINSVISRLAGVAGKQDSSAEKLHLNMEVVHEQEQEEEQEEEAEEEEQKVSAFTRDDEQHNPWTTTVLRHHPSGTLGEEPFYSFREFQVRAEQPKLAYPASLWLSDNFFKTKWRGLGNRKLKNVAIVMEWQVPVGSASGSASGSAADSSCGSGSGRLTVAISLAEGETLRWMMHTNQHITKEVGLALRTVNGHLMDKCAGIDGTMEESVSINLLCLRFFNGDMFYNEDELELLETGLSQAPLQARQDFFSECMRLRRRQRNLWADTPLAKIFTPQSEWHLLRALASLALMKQAMARKINSNAIDPMAMYHRVDVEGKGTLSSEETQRVLQSLHLGFAPGDYADVLQYLGRNDKGMVSIAIFKEAFAIPDVLPTLTPKTIQALERTASGGEFWDCPCCTLKNPKDVDVCEACGTQGGSTWTCTQCTVINPSSVTICDVCGFGMSGTVECPPGQWVCAAESGGCTKFNPNNLYYCEACDRARPDLPCMRF